MEFVISCLFRFHIGGEALEQGQEKGRGQEKAMVEMVEKKEGGHDRSPERRSGD